MLIDVFGIVRFDMDNIYDIAMKKIIGNKIGLADIMICWFGVIATK